MLSNHNKNVSSFRIIEPKQFQQAQQIPIPLAQQIPILSVKTHNTSMSTNSLPLNSSSSYETTTATSSPQQQHAGYNASAANMHQHHQYNNQYNHHQQQQQHQLQHHQQQHHHHHNHPQYQRTRNLSDTDSSCIPGKLNLKLILN
jgi:hypothetical protein